MGEPVEDMTTLSDLTENAILENLKERYARRFIYTYTGSILVALNPFERLDIYNTSNLKQYTNKRHAENPPHIFAVADAAYSNMRNMRQNQAVIISGESGAGKSESTKVILQFLTAVTSLTSTSAPTPTAAGAKSESWVEQQILEANTVLESFGNAKTVRNNNSSRFGKFIQVNFNAKNHIVGASIVNYLLEKSRIAKQAKTERNYHIFYELVAGVTDDERAKYSLEDAESFHYLSQSGCIEIPGVNDQKHFAALKLALTVLNMSPADQEGLFRTLSAILWMGNIGFKEDQNKESVTVDTGDVVEKVSGLIGIDAGELGKALVAKKLVIRGETSMVPYKLTQANDNRDSIAKAIYDNLFQRLVEFINKSLTPKEKTANFVGVLDIFGFEVFAINSFEQFCINYTNEKLQQFFNQFIFKLEQEEYDKESIKWDKIAFQDNAQCLDLIEAKPTGVLSLLDEETKFPKGTDESWLQKMDTANAKHPYYIKPKTQRGVFGVRHYAGDVMYTVNGFLEKNKDAIQEEIYDIVRASKNKFVSKIFPQKEEEAESPTGKPGPKGGARGGKPTAGGYFKNQLVSLVTVLGATMPHYVRCIKPNEEKEAFLFNDDMVLAQLRYSGMLDTIRIRKAGFPTRLAFDGFAKNYKALWPPGTTFKAIKDDPKAVATGICQGAGLPAGTWQAGKTKLFFKPEALDKLQDENDKVLKAKLVLVQSVMLGNMYRQRYLRMKVAVKLLQNYAKGFIAKRRYRNTRRAIIRIQSVTRGWFARDYYRALLAEKRELEAEEKRAAEAVLRAAEVGKRESLQPSGPTREDMQMIGFAIAVQKKKEAAAPPPVPTQAAPVLPAKLGPAPILPSKAKSAVSAKPEPEPTMIASPSATTNAVFDNLFAFLGDFDPSLRVGAVKGAGELAKMAAGITADIDSMFDEPVAPKKSVEEEVAKEMPGLAKAKAAALRARGGGKMGREESRRASITERGEEGEEEGRKGMMRGNPMLKKGEKLGSNTSLEHKKVNYHAIEYQMTAYGEKYFEEHFKPSSTLATLTRKQREKMDLQDMLSWSKQPILLSLTKIPNKTDKLNIDAVEAFRVLQKAMDPSSKKQEESVQAFVRYGTEKPELRDELYVQIIKQVTPPKGTLPKHWDQMLVLGWQVLAHSATAFPPSKVLSKFLLAFINRTLEQYVLNDKHPVRKLAQLADDARKLVLLNGARKYPPSLQEIAAVKAGNTIPFRFALLDGHDKDIPITSTTMAADIVKEIAKMVDLKDPSGWSLYEVALNQERALKATDYIADVLAAWEKNTLGAAASKKKDSAGPAFNMNSTLMLKKRIFRNPHEPIVDPVEYNLLYAQTVDCVAHDMYPITDRVAAQIAALRAHILLGDCDRESAAQRFSRELPDWVSPRLIPNQPKEAWVDSIVREYMRLRGTTAAQAKVLYLESAKQFKHYGTSLYPVKHKGFWSFSENILLAVHYEGLEFVHAKTKESIMTFPYRDVKNYEGEGNVLTIVAVPTNEDMDLESTEVYQFVTDHVEEIVSLIREYCPTTEYMKKAKETAIAELDIGALNRDIQKYRQLLMDHGVLRRPGPEGNAQKGAFRPAAAMTMKKIGTLMRGKRQLAEGNFGSTGSLRRGASSAKKADAQERQEAYDVPMGSMDSVALNEPAPAPGASTPGASIPQLVEGPEWTEADWSYSTKPLNTSLTPIQDNELEDWAADTYKTLLSFQGQPNMPVPDVASTFKTNIQSIAAKCIETPYLANEVYIQLIKLTTNHPEPDSPQVLSLWKMLSITAGALIPTGYMLEYAKAHLRRCGVVEKGVKKPRKEEAKYAKHCLRVLTKAVAAGIRRGPPSTEEVNFSSKMMPMRVRFHFMDGQFRAIPLDPSDSAGHVFESLLDRMKLRDLPGFAIFEQFGGIERAVEDNEKISDLMYKWEKYSQEEHMSDHVRFVLKKRLYTDPFTANETEMEENLELAQVLADVKADMFPLTDEEAVLIVALDIQANYGDSLPDKNLK
ncbi:cytochrome c oxidase subunit 1 [Rhizophlyctis rosea]|nr:cytochrome c oxidase subunit 1 [Rhizophlyctis rosea]